jgi:hypothetical protein
MWTTKKDSAFTKLPDVLFNSTPGMSWSIGLSSLKPILDLFQIDTDLEMISQWEFQTIDPSDVIFPDDWKNYPRGAKCIKYTPAQGRKLILVNDNWKIKFYEFDIESHKYNVSWEVLTDTNRDYVVKWINEITASVIRVTWGHDRTKREDQSVKLKDEL